MAFGSTFKALADPVRREILDYLKQGRMSAGDIAAKFDLTAATVSYHLSVLKKADLIFETKRKTLFTMTLTFPFLRKLCFGFRSSEENYEKFEK